MDEDKLQTTFISTLAELNAVLVDDMKELHDFFIINQDVLLVNWKYKSEDAIGGGKSNIFIACFTTSFARLELYRQIQKLQGRLFYKDTDSLILLHRPGMEEIPLGSFLGDYTSELTCPNVGCDGCQREHFIVEFYALGPKHYCLKCDTGKCIVKVRGFTLTGKVADAINFESMKELLKATVEGDDASHIVEQPSKITRNKAQSIIYNRPLHKKYRMIYDKRVIVRAEDGSVDYQNIDTRPYGF